MQHPHNGVLLPDFLHTPRVDDNVRDAYAADQRTPQAKATTLARKRARAVKYAPPPATNRRKDPA